MKFFHYTALSLTALGLTALMSTSAAQAQGRPAANDNQNQSLANQLRVCAAITGSTERLQCFDSLAARLEGDDQTRGAAAASRGQARAAEARLQGIQQREAAHAERDARAAEREVREEERGSTGAAQRDEALRQAEARAAEAEARARAAEAREAQRRAEAEERQRREPPSEKTYYEVVDVWQNPAGLQRMRMDNGQVWMQLSSADRVQIREGQRYFIEPGRVGNSFFIGADGSNRRMRVQLQR
ncbi:hypothetical protein [Aliidiomarina haloalkalitolerans]|uniref:Uncharacterized protein n=1 Tax=Aliidiomarina haloalkalitolerans TaxID=859059 RepID=A0A432VUV3_9GAMM|nr:hypothetical protein [Aliidiomarina haloalkalitolerans]RUO20252.1 hypothetical protein CWE06_06400 [Aliidiomarina haloalkalitolerans]